MEKTHRVAEIDLQKTTQSRPWGARTAGKILVGAAIGVWTLAALNLLTAQTGRPMTLTQQARLAEGRAAYWSCVRDASAVHRPQCMSLKPFLLTGKTDMVSVVINVLTTPLVALLAVLVLAGATLGFFLAGPVARGRVRFIRAARTTIGVAAAAAATLFVLGILPETSATAAMAQSLCFIVLCFLRTSPADVDHPAPATSAKRKPKAPDGFPIPA